MIWYPMFVLFTSQCYNHSYRNDRNQKTFVNMQVQKVILLTVNNVTDRKIPSASQIICSEPVIPEFGSEYIDDSPKPGYFRLPMQ